MLRDSLPLMRERGVSASILLLSGSGSEIRNDIEGNGFEVHGSRVRNLLSPAQVPEIRRCIDRVKPDIVHVHLFPALYWTALARPQRDPRIVFTEHNTNNRRRGQALLRPVENFIYRRYTKIICISEGVRRGLIEWQPWISERTVVVHNGVDVKRMSVAEPALREMLHPGTGPGDRLLVMVASFSGKKDHATVIRALSLLPGRFRLLLPGEGPTKESMMNLTEELGLGNRVSFPGNSRDIPGILRACDYAVQSSRWEGFGLAAVEAMAAGIPLLASRVEGLSEVVGDAGVLFEPGNHQVLADAILDLERHPLSKEEFRARGLARANEFRMENMVEKLISVYKAVMGRA